MNIVTHWFIVVAWQPELLTSNATNNSTWTHPPGRRAGGHNDSGSEELHFPDNASKSIRIDTVMNIQSVQDNSDTEAGYGTRLEGNEM